MNPSTNQEKANKDAQEKNTAAPVKHKKRSGFSLWIDQIRCSRTVRKWQKKEKKQVTRKKRRAALAKIPHIDLIGESLYKIGFWAEYLGVCILRTAGRVAGAILQHLGQLLLMILRPFGIGLVTLLEDITNPFVRFASGVRHMRGLGTEMVNETVRDIRHEKVQYSRRGAKLYLPLVWNALSYVLPIAAAVALVFTVRTWMDYHYVLEVQVDGQSVGCVESEQVFESAKEDVQSRINSAKIAMQTAGSETDDTQWEINPTFTLTVTGNVMSESEMTDAILRTSSGEISDGTAVYVDGALSYVTTEGDHLRAFLENIKTPYEDALDTNKRVEFVHNIELVDGVYFTSSISDYGSVVSALEENSTTYYTAADGDTVTSILENTGLKLDMLQAMNPDVTDADYPVTAGQVFVTSYEQAPKLQVKTVERTTITQDVAYSSQTVDSADYDYGKEVVVQEGQLGQEEVTYDIIYVNGVNTETVTIDVTRLVDPVEEIIARGTKLKSGMTASIGNGNFMWPVPGYTYVSRWMSSYHKGADICASYGTPIYASDSGVVETAQYHYSYGNYVVINHGNGYETLYAHMSAIAVSAGQSVQRGQVIGYVGSTGDSTGNHCHFEMYYNGVRFSAYQLFAGM